jgi:archaellum component FlaC
MICEFHQRLSMRPVSLGISSSKILAVSVFAVFAGAGASFAAPQTDATTSPSQSAVPVAIAAIAAETPVSKKDARQHSQIVASPTIRPSLFHPIKMVRPLFYGAIDELHGFHSDIDDLNGALNALPVPLTGLGAPIDGLKTNIGGLSNSVSELGSPIAKMQPTLSGIETQLHGFQGPLRSFAPSLRNLDHGMSGLHEPLRNIDRDMSGLHAPLRNLDREMIQLRQPLQSMNEPLRALAVSTGKISAPIGEVSSDLKNLRRPLESINSHMDNLSENVTGLQQELKAFRTTLASSIVTISLAIVIAAALIGASNIVAKVLIEKKSRDSV